MPGNPDVILETALRQPLTAISSLFDLANQPVNDPENDWGVVAMFSQLLKDPESYAKIPVVTAENVHNIPDGSLCRYQGMVQDMMDPEYYAGAYKQDGSWISNKYQFGMSAEQQNAESVIWERKPLYFSAIPGLSGWCKSANLSPQAAAEEKGVSQGAKRERDEADVDMADATDPGRSSKTAKLAESVSDLESRGAASAAEVPETQPGDCILYLYDKTDSLKLNDTVEILGILSKDPEIARMQLELQTSSEQLDLMDEALAARPLPSQAPRIHALVTRSLGKSLELPIITYKTSAELKDQVSELRCAALTFLTKVLGGDSIAAEYLLLQTISRTHTRIETGALGILNIGLSQSDSETNNVTAEDLTAAISTMVPMCSSLSVTIEELNKKNWRPVRDLRTSRLSRAALQLPSQLLLVLDETKLNAGQLTALGVANLQALSDLIENKSIGYDFNVYTMPMATDTPVCVLSKGKSLLHAGLNYTIPLKPAYKPAGKEEILAANNARGVGSIRAYLALVRNMDFAIEPPMGAFLENELLQAKKQDTGMDANQMSIWLTVARLLALSHGEDKLTQERWNAMKKLDHARQQRTRACI